MKKVLIITYYWPPAGGSGVQRWLKFVKYLPHFGIQPVVYTVDKKSFPIMDHSLKFEVPEGTVVLRRPILEPANLFSFFGKNNNESAGFLTENPSFLGRMKQFVRANFFIPDARKYWIKPSVNYLQNVIRDKNIDVVITTGPPHSTHLIGQRLKERLPVKWIADFRDPWTDIDYFHKLPLTKRSLVKHKALERDVVRQADAVLVVGNTMRESYEQFNKKVITVSNGFDSELNFTQASIDSKFTLTHIGLMNADRNPKILWEVLGEMIIEDSVFKEDFKLKLIGVTDKSILNSLSNYSLLDNIELIDYQPHKVVEKHQQLSQCLLLIVNNVPSAKGIVTGKVFEYMASGRPILAIGPEDGDLAEIIGNSRAGVISGFGNKAALRKNILTYYQDFKAGNLAVETTNIQQYHRKELTAKLVSIINEV